MNAQIQYGKVSTTPIPFLSFICVKDLLLRKIV